jgi:uncharacterized membrane protein YedE/YeeE
MKRIISFLLLGILFGIVMTKSEAISWFRIHEMFRFESFHMYGIIGTAVIFGAIFLFLMKRTGVKTWDGEKVSYKVKPMSYIRYILAGTIFGLGWALMGACPGPMFVLLGHGYWIFIVVIVSATIGAYLYGISRHKLPH